MFARLSFLHVFYLGYSYCNSCTDYQAMMPRRQEGQTGYDPMNVCGYCIEFLNSVWSYLSSRSYHNVFAVTAAGRGQLRSLSLGKLKKYAEVYHIRIDRAVEKDDVIDGLFNARVSGYLGLSMKY